MYIAIEVGGHAANDACPDYWQFGSQGGSMTEEPREIELSAEQKTELLNIGLKAATEEQEPSEHKADLLYDILNHPLPVDGPAVNMLPAPLRGLSRKVRSIAGAPLIELLTHSDTSISTIEAIKEYAKQSGKSAESEDRADIFLAVYYGAIASGLVFHGRKISEHSYEHLTGAFGSLADKAWMQEGITDLVARAQKHCDNEIGQVGRSNKP